MHSTKGGQNRDFLREQERLARHAQSSVTEEHSDVKNFPLFGEPIKVSKTEEDATSRRIRETLGDYKHAVSTFFGNSSKQGQRTKVSHKPPNAVPITNSESGSNHTDNHLLQKSITNGKLQQNGISAKESYLSSKPTAAAATSVKPTSCGYNNNQHTVNTNNIQDKFNISAKDKVNHFSNHDRTSDVNSLIHAQNHHNHESDNIPINKSNNHVIKQQHNSSIISSKDSALKLNIAKANDAVNHNADIKDVESILQEMQCDVPTLVTAIGTPSCENRFTFPVESNNLDFHPKSPPNNHGSNEDKSTVSEAKQRLESQDSEAEDESPLDDINKIEQPMLSPLKDSDGASSSSESSGSSSDSDDSSSLSESEEGNEPPAAKTDAHQSDSSESSINSQHSNSSNNQSWNLASFIKPPVQAVSNDNSMNGRSNRESAPYDPVGDEGPFGSVQSILSSLSSVGDDDGQKIDPLSPLPSLHDSVSYDKVDDMVASMTSHAKDMVPSSFLLSPVPTPSHSSYVEDHKLSIEVLPPPIDKSKDLFNSLLPSNHPSSQVKSATKDDTEDKIKSSNHVSKMKKSKNEHKNRSNDCSDRVREKSPKLNTPKSSKDRTNPSKTSSCASKRRKPSKPMPKSAEFLSDDSSSSSSSASSDGDDDVSPVLHDKTTKNNTLSHTKSNGNKPKSATKHYSKPNNIERDPHCMSPSIKTHTFNGYKMPQKSPKVEPNMVKDMSVEIEPLSPINSNINQITRSPIQSEKPRHKRQVIVQLDLALIDRIPGVHSKILNYSKDIETSEEKENYMTSFALVDDSNLDKKCEISSKDDTSSVKSSSSTKSKSHKRKHPSHESKSETKRLKALATAADDSVKKEPSVNSKPSNDKPFNGALTHKIESSALNQHEDQSDEKRIKKENKEKKKSKSSIDSNESKSSIKTESISIGDDSRLLQSPASRSDNGVKSKKSSKSDTSKDSKSLKVETHADLSSHSPRDDGKVRKHKISDSESGANAAAPEDKAKKPKKDTVAPSGDVVKAHKVKHDDSKEHKKHADHNLAVSSSQSQSRTNREVKPETKKPQEKQVSNNVNPSKEKASLPLKEQADCYKRSSDYYLSEAKALKHQADKEENRTAQAMKYLEAVLYFILTGNAMENNRVTNDGPTYTMYKDTLTLIRFISYKFKGNHNSQTASVDNKLAVLSLRVQSLLQLKLFHMKRNEIKDFQKQFSDYQKNPSKFMQSQPQVQPQQQVVNGKQLSQPSPQLSNNTNGWISGTKTTGTPSPLSPTPSPAGSVASVGSQSSGYSSCDVPPKQQQQQHNSNASVHNAFLHALAQQYTNLQHAGFSHDLWDQADALVLKTNCQDFFKELDEQCGKLSLHTSLTDLVKYITEGLHRLKTN